MYIHMNMCLCGVCMLGKSRKLVSPKDDIKGVCGAQQEDIAMKLQVAVQSTKSLNLE